MFDRATNEPAITTLDDLFTILQPVPAFDIAWTHHRDPLIVAMDNATWVNPWTLAVSFPRPAFQSIYDEVLRGMIFQVTTKACPPSLYNGSFDLRLNEQGNYTLAFAYQSGDNKGQRLRLGHDYEAPIIRVRNCKSLLVHIDKTVSCR